MISNEILLHFDIWVISAVLYWGKAKKGTHHCAGFGSGAYTANAEDYFLAD